MVLHSGMQKNDENAEKEGEKGNNDKNKARGRRVKSRRHKIEGVARARGGWPVSHFVALHPKVLTKAWKRIKSLLRKTLEI